MEKVACVKKKNRERLGARHQVKQAPPISGDLGLETLLKRFLVAACVAVAESLALPLAGAAIAACASLAFSFPVVPNPDSVRNRADG